MTDAEETTGQVPVGLDVRLAAELIERAKAQGVSLVGPEELLAGITKTVLQAALDAEMTEHLGYEKGERPDQPGGNHRNGRSPKTVLTEVGAVGLQVPRDRAAATATSCSTSSGTPSVPARRRTGRDAASPRSCPR